MAADEEDSIFVPGIIVRLQYCMYLLAAFGAIFLLQSTTTFFDRFPLLRAGCAKADSTILRNACSSDTLVYRVSFGLTLFFFLHWLSVSDLTCCIRSSSRAEMQTRFFSVKTALLVALVGVTLLIPNGFFVVYAYVCLFASAFYLLLNVVFLVDFSYQWSDDWGERADDNDKWMWYLLLIAVGSYAVGVAINIASFVFFVPHADCNYNAFAITSVLVGGLLYTVLSVWVPHGSVVPSGIVFLYTSAIMFVTLRSSQDDHCNRFGAMTGQQSNTLVKVIGFVVPYFMLVYTVATSGGSGSSLNIGLDEDGEFEDADRTGHLSHYMFFFFIMMLGSMYLAMLMTGWHVSGGGENTLLGSINVAFWVRSSCVWLATALYVWSLVAPYTCCKGRDFGFAVDDDWQ